MKLTLYYIIQQYTKVVGQEFKFLYFYRYVKKKKNWGKSYLSNESDKNNTVKMYPKSCTKLLIVLIKVKVEDISFFILSKTILNKTLLIVLIKEQHMLPYSNSMRYTLFQSIKKNCLLNILETPTCRGRA